MALTAQQKKDIASVKASLKNPKLSEALKKKLEAKLALLEVEGNKPTTEATKKKAKSIMSEIEAIMKKYPNIKTKYANTSKPDLLRDAKRSALPAGKRISADGNIYYENRANRVDVRQPSKTYPRLEKGGSISEYGGGGSIERELNNYIFEYYYPKYKRQAPFSMKYKIDDKEIILVGGTNEAGYNLIGLDGKKTNMVITVNNALEAIEKGEYILEMSSGYFVTIKAIKMNDRGGLTKPPIGEWIVYNPETDEIISTHKNHNEAKKEAQKLLRDSEKYQSIGWMAKSEYRYKKGGSMYEHGGELEGKYVTIKLPNEIHEFKTKVSKELEDSVICSGKHHGIFSKKYIVKKHEHGGELHRLEC